MSFQYSKYGCIVTIGSGRATLQNTLTTKGLFLDFGTTYSGSSYTITGGLTDKEIRNKHGKEIIQNADLNSNLKKEDVYEDKDKSEENEGYKTIAEIRRKEISRLNIAQIDFRITQTAERNKTPTIVIYDRYKQLSSWGIHAKLLIEKDKLGPSDRVLREFKLHLPKSVSQKDSVQRLGSMEQNTEDNNLRATIDFFKVVYDHIYESLHNERVSTTYSFDNRHIRFVITVPAIWTDIERAVMRQVAIQAGLINESDHKNRLVIINESLAATLFAERELSKNLLVEGDKYIICDAGGGTVDISSFVKTQEQEQNISFDRCQLTADSGGECGSTFIDKEMWKVLSRVLHNEEIDKNYVPDTTDKDIIEDIESKKKDLEKLIDIFTDGDDSGGYETSGKHIFGHSLDNNISDEEYFARHRENFDELKSHATVFKKFYFPIDLIEDKDYELVAYNEFKYWGEHDYERFYVNRDGIYFSEKDVLYVPFEVMVKQVFKNIIDQTLVLLHRQIKKLGGKVKVVFLVGGLGRNYYLSRRITQKFGDQVEKIEQNGQGNLAAMRGAAYYGLDGVKRQEQTDIAEEAYEQKNFLPDDFNTVICIDIGYDHASCSYVNLPFKEDELNENTVEVTEWPGAKNSTDTQIPTAYQKDGPNVKWGAQVPKTTNVEQEKLIVPSRLMAVVKGDLKNFLVEFLKKLHAHVLDFIKKKEGKEDATKFRYCVTMENSYKFFNRKEDMRRICTEAGLVTETCNPRRLLLFKREDATAMHLEKTKMEKNKYSTYFLQVFFRHDSCHLVLHESIKINGFVESKAKADEEDSKYFRNVRAIRSTTLEFDFVSKLIANLDMFITKNPCITCSAVIRHNDHYSSYYSDLRKGFLDYVRYRLDFSSNEHSQEIAVRDNCCVISISVYDLLEHVFRPAIRDLISEINRHVTQTDINNFQLAHVFLLDRLFKAQENTYGFLEKILIKTLAEVMNVEGDNIHPAEEKNVAAIGGAVLYGSDPFKYTERVSRKTYMLTVTAFNFQEFEDDVKKKLEELTDEDEIYDYESKNAFQGTERLELFYQPAYNPSKKFKIGQSYQNLLIRRGTKITEHDQAYGIQKRFFAEKECLVHATVYTSENNGLEFPPPDAEGADTLATEIPSHFQKIHQFEIYIKADPNDPMNQFGSPRHYFDIRMTPDNNEIKFEANIGTRTGEKIPEFRFRDEILVANIYDDRTEILLTKTSREYGEDSYPSTNHAHTTVENEVNQTAIAKPN